MLLFGWIICLVGEIGGISHWSKVEVSNVDLKYDVRNRRNSQNEVSNVYSKYDVRNLWYSQCIRRIQRIIKVRIRRKKPPDIMQQHQKRQSFICFDQSVWKRGHKNQLQCNLKIILMIN